MRGLYAALVILFIVGLCVPLLTVPYITVEEFVATEEYELKQMIVPFFFDTIEGNFTDGTFNWYIIDPDIQEYTITYYKDGGIRTENIDPLYTAHPEVDETFRVEIGIYQIIEKNILGMTVMEDIEEIGLIHIPYEPTEENLLGVPSLG